LECSLVLADDPVAQAGLRHMPSTARTHLKRDLDVRGPLDPVGCNGRHRLRRGAKIAAERSDRQSAVTSRTNLS